MNKLFFIFVSFFVFSAQALDLEKLKADMKKKAEERRAQKQQQQQAAVSDLPAAPVCDAVLRNGICYSFTGSDHADSKKAKGNEMACKLLRGRMLPAARCPSQRLLGRCKIVPGDTKEYVLHYYQKGKFDLAKAQEDCANAKSGLHAQGAGVWM